MGGKLLSGLIKLPDKFPNSLLYSIKFVTTFATPPVCSADTSFADTLYLTRKISLPDRLFKVTVVTDVFPEKVTG
jgi:hypothetical protein